VRMSKQPCLKSLLPGGGNEKNNPLPNAERRRTFVVLNVKFS
jgi:hypothetical protein